MDALKEINSKGCCFLYAFSMQLFKKEENMELSVGIYPTNLMNQI